MCGSRETYEKVVAYILANRADANVDEERATLVVELVKAGIRKEINDDPDKYAVFLRTAVVNHWCGKQLNVDVQDVRNMANTGKVKCFDASAKRYPTTSGSSLRASGILFVGENVSARHTVRVPILTMSGENTVKVAGYCEDGELTAAIRVKRARLHSAADLRLGTVDAPGEPADTGDPVGWYDPAEGV